MSGQQRPILAARLNGGDGTILSQQGALATFVRNSLGNYTLTRDTDMGPSWDADEIHVEIGVEGAATTNRTAVYQLVNGDRIDVFVFDGLAYGVLADATFSIQIEAVP